MNYLRKVVAKIRRDRIRNERRRGSKTDKVIEERQLK